MTELFLGIIALALLPLALRVAWQLALFFVFVAVVVAIVWGAYTYASAIAIGAWLGVIIWSWVPGRAKR